MASNPAPSAGSASPLVGIIMGSRSDLRIMAHAAELLGELQVPHEVLEVIVAAAGGAAHLPGMVAALTILPVLGVPIPATMLNGVDALLAIVQMPKGVPVGTLAIGEPGAANAALLAAAIIGQRHPEVRDRLRAWRAARTAAVMADTIIAATP
jgi:5-(carboxyamino)imidazole ribonucleotide mutase